VRAIQSQMRRQISAVVEGTGGKLNSLSQIGIGFQQDGSLKVDSSKLNKAITDNAADFGGLFAAMGSTTDGLVKFDKSTAATKAGTYGLNITSLATQGTLASSAALGATTTIAPNTVWRVTLNDTDPVTDSKTQQIKLPAGTYSKDDLAALLRSSINGNAVFAGAGDTAESKVGEDGILTLSSSKYGSTSNISLTSVSGSSIDSIFGGAAPSKGADVAGTIGGVAATGNGQALTAAPGSNAEGIQVSITGGILGDRGTVTFSQGFAFQLNNLATSFVGKDSLLKSKTDGLNVSIKSVADQAARFETRLDSIEKRYRAQFVALDAMMSSMQSTSDYLTQQLASIAANS
jgi:flagellar hook-associated protein 2